MKFDPSTIAHSRPLWLGSLDYMLYRENYCWTRIVIQEKEQPLPPEFVVETASRDALGHDSWRALNSERHPMAQAMALALLDCIGARPRAIEAPVTEVVTGSNAKASWAVFHAFSLEYQSAFAFRLSIALLDGLNDDKIVRTILEVPYKDAEGRESWSRHAWLHSSPPKRSSAAESVLGAALIQTLKIAPQPAWNAGRFEMDQPTLASKSGLIPPSRYVPCSCGKSRADDDYELKVLCRHCGGVIGPAQ
jgi:hypothetical protein